MKKMIAFVGIDGAGKTTIIKRVSGLLEKRGKKCGVYYMGLGRDLRMPFLKKAMGAYSHRKYSSKKTEGGEGVKRDNYRVRSFYWLLVYYSELFLRYFRARFSRKDYVLFDRYFYDGLVFSGEGNFSWLRRFIPKPDKCFLIYAPATVIRKRKKEAEMKDIEEFYSKMDKVGDYFEVDIIDNTRKLEEVEREILEKLGYGEK